jgi:ABC-2 type transport system permease protein
VETLRGLMLGTPIGSHAATALVWCAGLAALGIAGAAVLFRRAS